MAKRKDKLVYSTKTGDVRKKNSGSAGPSVSLPPNKQTLKIMREKSGRRGKMVTVISGFTLTAADLKSTAKQLKNLCGAGGTVKNDGAEQIVEIQGDHREKIAEALQKLGYKTKLAGG